MVNNFPSNFDEALKSISTEFKIKLLKETHYEARNRELHWLEKNRLHRLDFNFDNNMIAVTHYIDKFSIPLPKKILIWCHDYIPGFPYCAKISWEKLSPLPLELSKEEYKARLEEIIDRR